METQITTPVYSEGKMSFSSPTEAIDVQLALLNAGFSFESDNQHPRPGAYGIMWRREWIKGAWKCTIRTAANAHVFKAYGAHRKHSIYNDGAMSYNNEEGRRRQREISQEQQSQTDKEVFAIFSYLMELGYDPNARNTKKGKPIRIATWTAFVHLLNDVSPKYRPYQVRRAMKRIAKSPPEWVKLNELERTRKWHGRKLAASNWKHLITAGMEQKVVVPNIAGDGFVILGKATSNMTVKQMNQVIEMADYLLAELA